jgi:hypothetical protein
MAFLGPLRDLFGARRVSVPSRVKAVEVTGEATVTVKAGTPVNTPIPVSIKYDPQKPEVTTITPAVNETWEIADLFITEAPAVDGVVQFVKNDYEILQRTNPLSVYRADWPQRDRITPVVVGPLERLNLYFFNASSPTSDQTVKFYLKIRIYRTE